MLISSLTKFQDQYFVEYDTNHVLTNCSVKKEELDIKGELVGIHKISNSFYQQMCIDYQQIVEEKPKLGYEYELLHMSQSVLPVHVLKVENLNGTRLTTNRIWTTQKNIWLNIVYKYKQRIMDKTVYIGMTADIMHPGLIHIIHEATKYGNVMIGLLTDKAIAYHKRLPYLTYEQRKEIVENIKGVSIVVPQEEWSYVDNLKNINRILLFTEMTGKMGH